jgi:hypothetical protein
MVVNIETSQGCAYVSVEFEKSLVFNFEDF